MARSVSVLNYAFAIGKIKALEKSLIREEVFKEAIQMDLGGALRLFVEADLYSEELLKATDSRKLEEVLELEAYRLRGTVSELLLDKGLLALLDMNSLEAAQACLAHYRSGFLKGLLMRYIDFHNIKTFVRLRVAGARLEDLMLRLRCCGYIGREAFAELYPKDTAEFIRRLEYVHTDTGIIDYAQHLRDPLQKAFREGSFVALEKALQDQLIRALSPARYITFGPEPILAYYFAKMNEIQLVRMVILAKLLSVPQELTEARVNEAYA